MKKWDISFGIIVIVNYIFVAFFFEIFGVNRNTYIYSICHSIMASILITQLKRNIKKGNNLSIGYLLLYVTTMYFQFSVIKYCRTDAFYGFSKDNGIRMKGTVIVFCVLFFTNLLMTFRPKKSVSLNIQVARSKNYLLVSYLMSCILVLYYFIIRDYYNSIYINANYKVESIYVTILINFITCLGIYFSTITWNVKNPISLIPLIMDVVCFAYGSMKSGSRASFFSYALLVLYMLVQANAIHVKCFTMAQIIAPWFMMIFTYFSFRISGRYTNNMFNGVARNLAYRFDLSDLAINIMNNTSWIRHDFEEIVAGVQNCIPSIISTKYKGFGAYKNMLLDAFLLPGVDYSDTFFSMGASVGGIVGMVLIIPILYIIYEKIDYCLNNQGRVGTFVKMLSILCLVRIETEWISFICEIRNLLLEIIIVLIIYYFVKTCKKCKFI